MAHHSVYWNCSTFADWLRGTPKGRAKSFEDWETWRKEAEAAHPIRFWLAETALSTAQDVLTWPFRKVYDAKYYLINRFVTKTHALTSSLKRGAWHEYDTRVLHCLFDELVNYVEVEEAWSNVAWDSAARARYKPPIYGIGRLRTRTWRCAEAGLDKLNWAAGLTEEDDEGNSTGVPTRQAQGAKEIIELYKWWTTVYPQRADPHDVSGWTAICEKRREDGLGIGASKTPEEADEIKRALELTSKIEQEYDDEDTEMLIRLIKVRRNMWT